MRTLHALSICTAVAALATVMPAASQDAASNKLDAKTASLGLEQNRANKDWLRSSSTGASESANLAERGAKKASESFFIDDAVGYPGGRAIINVMVKNDISDQAYLAFNGLPEGFTLSTGVRYGRSWIVTLRELDKLAILCPPNVTGSFTLDVQFIKDQKSTPETVRISVEIMSKIVKDPSEKTALSSGGSSSEGGLAHQLTEHEIAEHKKQMQKAKELIASNDIAAARLVYVRMAKTGSRDAALALAQTYDPAFFSHYTVSGMKPDIEQARYWYAKAVELGSDDARGRLLTVDARRPGK